MIWQLFLLIPVACACLYWLMTSVCMAIFFLRKKKRCQVLSPEPGSFSPFVSLIKPVCGLEKNLYENLATACLQNYPRFEVIYSVQNPADPALKVLKEIRKNYPGVKMQIVIDEEAIGPNGRLANIYNASKHAEGEVLVFSDSDMFLKSDYLKTIVAPLGNKEIGVSCTLYKAWCADSFEEYLELLSFNADFIPSVVFATVTHASLACPGASQAVRRDVLEQIGGLAPLAHFLVEDFELGRRAVEAGYKIHFSPYVAATGVDLKNFLGWWRHQVYWDQNTRAAAGVGFFFTLLIRGIPFAVLYAFSGGPDAKLVLTATVGVRLFTTWINSFFFLKDTQGLKAIGLLPIRDILGFFVWFASFVKRKTVWKDRTFIIEKGKMVEVES
ncbi:MAG: glycosyltransferase [Deltaproteobacteria bacterium]|nr:glycosyltransferase [Deltaproteobacteria bacterium]